MVLRQIFLKFGALFLLISPSLAEAGTISITTVSKLTIETVKSVSGKSYRMRGTLTCLLYTSPSPRDRTRSRMPSSA